MVEMEMLGNKQTVLQINGFRSRPRSVEGITKSQAVKEGIESLRENLRSFDLTDHRGAKRKAFIKSLEWDEILDATNLGHTFKYTMTLLRRPDVV